MPPYNGTVSKCDQQGLIVQSGSPLKISSGRNVKLNPEKSVLVTFLPDGLPHEMFKGDPSVLTHRV